LNEYRANCFPKIGNKVDHSKQGALIPLREDIHFQPNVKSSHPTYMNCCVHIETFITNIVNDSTIALLVQNLKANIRPVNPQRIEDSKYPLFLSSSTLMIKTI
jgi:hypothetical protein